MSMAGRSLATSKFLVGSKVVLPSSMSLPLGQQGHHGAVLQAGMATADQLLCGKKQYQVGTNGGPSDSEGVDVTIGHKKTAL